MGPVFVLNFILCLLTTFIQIATSIRVYDVKANDANIGSQTAVISWTTDTTTDSLNSTIRGFRIDANYLLSRKGREILDPDITNATLRMLRSGVTYRACVIILINNTLRGNNEVLDNSACVSFTTDFVAINSYSLTALGIAICIIILFIVTQLIDFLCPREGTKKIESPPTGKKSQTGDIEEAAKKESRKKSHDVAGDRRREPGRSNRTDKQNKRKRPHQSDSKRKPQRDKDKHQKGMNKKKNVDGSKGGGGKHKSVKA